MARSPKKPKAPQTVDLFADDGTSTAPAPPRRRGRRSNHDQGAGLLGPASMRKPEKTKNASLPGTVPANINNIKDIRDEGSIEDYNKSPEILENIDEIVKALDLKGKMTVQELKFIQYHIVKGDTVKRAMIMAGYDVTVEGTMYYRAKKIIEKYEANEEDHRNIMRALGAGEVFVIAGMVKLAKEATSEIAKAQALTTLGKWLGMDKDVLQAGQGVTVIIQAYDGAQQQVTVGAQGLLPAPHPSGYHHPQPSVPGQPIQITK